MASQNEKNSVIKTMRACILSIKGGLHIQALDRDYRSIVGSPIPYKKLGYSSLEALVDDADDLYCTRGPRGEPMVHAELNESSAHIAEMIHKQKSTSKKKTPNFSSRGGGRHATPHWKPPPPRYNTPKRPVPSLLNEKHMNYASKTPLSITIGNEERNPRKVVVNKKSDEDTYHRSYELPPRFQKTEANMEKGPRFSNGRTDSRDEDLRDHNLDLREKLNNIRQKNSPPEKDENHIENRLPSPSNLQNNEYDFSKTSKSSIISPFSPKNAAFGAEEKKNDQVITPRWLRTNPNAEKDGYSPSYKIKLENYSKARDWPDPIYKILSRQPKGQPTFYGCQVKVGNDKNFSSYPEETYNKEDAQELAAKKAYNKLIEIEANVMNVTHDLTLIESRVTEIVERFPCGVWSEEVVKIYADQYNETLPDHWVSLTNTEKCTIKPVCQGRAIFYPYDGQHSEEIVHAETRLNNISIDPSFEKVNETEDLENLPIADQILPMDNNWDVFISTLVCSNKVYLRLIGEEYSDKYEALVDEIELFYAEGRGTVCQDKDIAADSYYIGRQDDNWYRVCVFEILEDGENCNCHLIDNGEYDTFRKSDLYFMERQFCRLQPQAVLCSLAGIDDIDDSELCDKIFDLIIARTFVATIDVRNDEMKEYSLTLHDTSVDPEMNVNEVILNMIDSMYQPPDLLKDNGIKQVYVSHIAENGSLYVQIQSARFLQLEKLTESLDEELILRHLIPTTSSLQKGKRYLAKFSEDENYYRAVVTEMPSKNDSEVEMMFIDYGNVEKVNISYIADLEALSPALYKIHPQAIHVKLYDLKIEKKGFEKLKELLPQSEPVLIKVCKFEGGESPPEVEVFKRLIQPDGSSQLISINPTISFEQDQARNSQIRKSFRKKEYLPLRPPSLHSESSGATSPDLKDLSALTRKVLKVLKSPPIPDVNEDFFDVYVTMAANPTNFIIQPLITLQVLGQMTYEMKKFYDEHDEEYKIEPDELIEGGFYAAIDGEEVKRVRLASVLDNNMFASVHACDCGAFKMVDVSKLRYLDERFTELPYQAIKAKLVGVKPTHGDWNPSDCLFFQKLVVGKCLVSIVKENGPDVVNNLDTVLGLQLFDTNSDCDLIIHNELIRLQRAVPE